MNQVEQWFGTLQLNRLGSSDCAALQDLEAKILKYINHHNQHAGPYGWTTKSVAKVMAWAEREVKSAA